MRIHRRVIVFDAADIRAEADFWATLLGGTADGDEHWQGVIVDGEWVAGVQHAPDHVAPQWPAGSAPAQQQQVHLDLHVDDLDEAIALAVAAGGRLVVAPRRPVDNPGGDECFATCASPAGHLVDLGLHPGT